MMSHIVTQLQSPTPKPDNYGALSRSRKTFELRQKDKKLCPTIKLDFDNASAKNRSETPETNSPSMARGTKTPRTPNFKLLLTPESAVSAVFESPLKSSPSSSISSVQSVSIVPKDSAPLAELEDTSLVYKYCELEDTSEIAVRSSKKLAMASTTSMPTLNQAIVLAVDQQFSRYESETRRLRIQLASTEQSLVNAMTSLNQANVSLERCRETITYQEEEISHKSQLIINLEKEVDHCVRHHLPPPTPSKERALEAAFSRFNLERKYMSYTSPGSDLAITQSPRGSRTPAITPNVPAETYLSASSNPSPRSLAGAASPSTQPLSAAGSPRPDHHPPGLPVSRPATCTPVMAKAFSEAFNLKNGQLPDNTLKDRTFCSTISRTNHQPQQNSMNRTSNYDSASASKPQSRYCRHRDIHSLKSSPNLVAPNASPPYHKRSHSSQDPQPFMSGGLGISYVAVPEMRERRSDKQENLRSDWWW